MFGAGAVLPAVSAAFGGLRKAADETPRVAAGAAIDAGRYKVTIRRVATSHGEPARRDHETSAHPGFAEDVASSGSCPRPPSTGVGRADGAWVHQEPSLPDDHEKWLPGDVAAKRTIMVEDSRSEGPHAAHVALTLAVPDAIIGLHRRLTPTQKDIQEPVTVNGIVGRAVKTPRFDLIVENVRVGRKLQLPGSSTARDTWSHFGGRGRGW